MTTSINEPHIVESINGRDYDIFRELSSFRVVTQVVGSHFCFEYKVDHLHRTTSFTVWQWESVEAWWSSSHTDMFIDALYPTKPEIQMFELTHGLDITDAMSIVHNIISQHKTY